jgi:hypothetical protein
MPGVQTLLNDLNSQFTPSQIGQTAKKREEFAPGKPLVGVLVGKQHSLHPIYQRYLKRLPEAIQETLRSVIYHALGDKDLAGKPRPPRQITFAWMPGYDYEITVTDVGDTKKTPGGITVFIRSPYDK